MEKASMEQDIDGSSAAEAKPPWRELDSDEINSIASDELYESRPNRWHGSKSTWRALTDDERLLWQSMERAGVRDLGVHLYNVSALKRRAKDPATAQDLIVQTEDNREVIWTVPRLWTAWPLAEGRLPREDFVARKEDEDEPFTFRRKTQPIPSSDLREELEASMMRTAKNRFNMRKKKWSSAVHQSVEEAASDATTNDGDDTSMDDDSDDHGMSDYTGRSQSSPMKSEAESTIPDDGTDDSQQEDAASVRSTRRGRRYYEPLVSADDEYSRRLLGPSVRHILSRLDATLSILHSTRNMDGYESDSSTADDKSDSQPDTPRHKGPSSRHPSQDRTPSQPQKPRPGRPRKARVPQAGESHDEMLLRLAREGHRRMPGQAAEARNTELEFEKWLQQGEQAAGALNTESDFEKWLQQDEQAASSREQSIASSRPESIAPSDTTSQDAISQDGTPVRRGTRLLGLRDWSDIIGAASLAGFPPAVIARTAKRCANLFGESMTIRNLHEAPASSHHGIHTTVYHPRQTSPSSSSDSSIDALPLLHGRIASRQASLAPTTPSPRRSLTPSPGSRSASAGQRYFCPVSTCDRAVRGFARRGNLRRHIASIHSGDTAGASESIMSSPADTDVDSEDEVHGAVHVDGFLRTIVPGRGWRREDIAPRRPRKRQRTRENDSDGDEEDSD